MKIVIYGLPRRLVNKMKIVKKTDILLFKVLKLHNESEKQLKIRTDSPKTNSHDEMLYFMGEIAAYSKIITIFKEGFDI